LPVPRARGKRDFTLVEPVNSLLATAWPALKRRFAGALKTGKPQERFGDPRKPGDRVHRRFRREQSARDASRLVPHCCAACHWIINPRQTGLAIPQRIQPSSDWNGIRDWPSRLYARHEAACSPRSGHSRPHPLEELAACAQNSTGRLPARRFCNLNPASPPGARCWPGQPLATRIAAEAHQLALKAPMIPSARGSSHPRRRRQRGRWTALCRRSRSVRVDRIFQAGLAPCTEGTIAGGSSTTKPRTPTTWTLLRPCRDSASSSHPG